MSPAQLQSHETQQHSVGECAQAHENRDEQFESMKFGETYH